MRKTLIVTIIALLVIVFGYMLMTNTTIAGATIYGIPGLNEENEKLDTKIETASKLSTTDYQKALLDLSNSAKEYTTTKESYEEMVTLSTEDQEKAASQLEKYEIEYLWTRIGNHATSENVQLKLEIGSNSTSTVTGYYDLKFTAIGSYVGITDFIYDVENDSSLGFKVENFKMQEAGSEDNLQATFTCKDISINVDSLNSTTTTTTTTEDTTETESTTNTSNSSKVQNTVQNVIDDNFSIR